MRIALVTDAWLPQTNGVVRTLTITAEKLSQAGHEVTPITPADFRTVPCPTYPEIRLSLFAARKVRRRLDALDPDAVHIATEGPLGLAARRWCLRRGRAFTTSYHTQFPEYVRARFPIPVALSYAFLRWFHGSATRTLVATPSMRNALAERGFRNLVLWSRGVDTELFRPRDESCLELPRPIWLYFGRVSVEKGSDPPVEIRHAHDARRLARRLPERCLIGIGRHRPIGGGSCIHRCGCRCAADRPR